jgi:hypothetical protein
MYCIMYRSGEEDANVLHEIQYTNEQYIFWIVTRKESVCGPMFIRICIHVFMCTLRVILICLSYIFLNALSGITLEGHRSQIKSLKDIVFCLLGYKSSTTCTALYPSIYISLQLYNLPPLLALSLRSCHQL